MFYHKYRPQTIAELDNEKIRATLGKALLANKFASAYLLTGPKGTGKTTTARIIAKLLNCSHRKVGEEPCNKCDSCRAITEGRSLDVIEIDAASNTGVEDIRDLREKAKLAPTVGPFKVYIIDEVHMLSNSAFNALLKTLEEPPTHVVFVLATTDPQKLPETVISRCQHFEFGKAQMPGVKSAITRAAKGEGIKIDEEAIAEIIKMAGGSLRDAHKILEQVSDQTHTIDIESVRLIRSSVASADVKEFLSLLTVKNAKDSLIWLSEFSVNDGNIKNLIEECVAMLRQEMLAIHGVNPSISQFKLSSLELSDLLSRFDRAFGELRDAVTPTLPLELLIVEWGDLNSVSVIKEQSAEIKTEKKADTGFVEKEPAEENASLSKEKWQEVIEKTKPFNHSVSAFLRAAKPASISDDVLTIAVAYKFHLDKLSEDKNRRVVEQVVGDIIPGVKRVKFELAKK